MGTPAYMSPEQAARREPDRRPQRSLQPRLRALRDAGRRAAVHRPDGRRRSSRSGSSRPSPRCERRATCPEAVDDAVTRALARTPVDRYPDRGRVRRGAAPIAATRHRARSAPRDMSSAAPKAIAVLPLANMSADPENEYFSDGMTEEIINALGQGARHPGRLAHVAPSPSRGRTWTCGRSARSSASASVLEGSVRKVGQPASASRRS